jgi:hypothetical protein
LARFGTDLIAPVIEDREVIRNAIELALDPDEVARPALQVCFKDAACQDDPAVSWKSPPDFVLAECSRGIDGSL